MNKTIVALATPPARSAIAVLRLSGPDALAIADQIFSPLSGRPLQELPGYRAAYGSFSWKGETLDEGIALVLCAPKSYTGEEMAELSCHGNPSIAARLYSCCIEAGAIPAAAGEFTRRAFENGKLDLSQAEAVAELIESDGAAAATAALARRGGALTIAIDRILEALSHAAASLAVWGDYPEEEDSPAMTHEGMMATLTVEREALCKLQAGYRSGALLQQGIAVAIVGSPNVGKSTLLNRLSNADCSIVTEIAGTTRDIVESRVELDGISLRLLDTAGIHHTEDPVEKLGVQRARQAVETSDLVLFLLDRTCPFGEQEQALYQQIALRPHLVVANKADLPAETGMSFQPIPTPDVEISAETGAGLEALTKKMLSKLGVSLTQDHCLIASQRQYHCVCRSIAALDETLVALQSGITLDAAGVLLDDAIAPLAELIGKQVSEAVLEQVFSHFCVGK